MMTMMQLLIYNSGEYNQWTGSKKCYVKKIYKFRINEVRSHILTGGCVYILCTCYKKNLSSYYYSMCSWNFMCNNKNICFIHNFSMTVKECVGGRGYDVYWFVLETMCSGTLPTEMEHSIYFVFPKQRISLCTPLKISCNITQFSFFCIS